MNLLVKPLFVIFCGAKCGSMSLYLTFKSLGYDCYHCHGLLNWIDQKHEGNVFEIILEQSKNRKVYIIDSYRTPIERKISSFFQNIEIHIPDYKQYTVDELIDIFNQKYIFELENYHPINEWFDYLSLPRFTTFDFVKKNKILEYNNLTFIKLLFDNIESWDSIISEILGFPIIINKENSTYQKEISGLYKDFLSKYVLPDFYLDELISEKEFLIHNSTSKQFDYINKWNKRLKNYLPLDFKPIDYKLLNNDLVDLKDSEAKIHYIKYCKKENRTFQLNKYLLELPLDFNPKEYIEFNDDLIDMSDIKAKIHYLQFGKSENRVYKLDPRLPSDFNWKEYIMLNDDLSSLNPLDSVNHYIKYGIQENRKYCFVKLLPSDFNVKEYILLNPDLENLNSKQAIFHYILSGKKEKREYCYPANLPKEFRYKEYLAINQDLANFNVKEAIQHYLLYGITEKRFYSFHQLLPSDFNPDTYIQLQSDLSKFNHHQAKLHYILYGKSEGRLFH